MRHLKRRTAGVLAVALAVSSGVVAASVIGATPAAAAVVRTDAGPVRGTIGKNHRAFLGIPYAEAPVGALRWRAPRPVQRWTTPRDATRPGSLCAQRGEHLGDDSLTEDCLYLNVTTPRHGKGNQRLPVMVWLHGGSFKDGGSHLYDAKRLATKGNVIVVTINYRLGVFGFLAHPALNEPGQGEMSGNFGLQDQQAALRWVRRNAAAFGGDPSNVTLFGQSAGALSTCAHLAAPGSAGLFHRAILQSGNCSAGWSDRSGDAMINNARPRKQAERDGRAIVAQLEFDGPRTAQRLRAATTGELLDAVDAAGNLGFGPVVGGGMLPLNPAAALETGQFHQVPVLHGINRHEQRMQVWGYELGKYQGPIPAAAYSSEIRAAFGVDAKRVLRHYPLEKYDSASQALAAALTDADYARPTMDTARALATRVPTYTYEFADHDAPWFKGYPEPYPMGAYHAAELPYLFDVDHTESLTTAQQRLADQMIGYWTRFARSGNPNGAGAPAWRAFSVARPSVQALGPGPGGIAPVNFARAHRYNFWNGLPRS